MISHIQLIHDKRYFQNLPAQRCTYGNHQLATSQLQDAKRKRETSLLLYLLIMVWFGWRLCVCVPACVYVCVHMCVFVHSDVQAQGN